VTGPVGGPFAVAGAHGYTALGLHTVTVRMSSTGGSRATTTATTLSFTNPAGGGSFVVGSQKATGAVTFWGAQWMKTNGINATSSFKGWADQTPPACGSAWSAHPATGGSSLPPAQVPSYMPVLVTSAMTQSGPTATGNVVAVVIVRTNPGYGPDPGLTGTGTVVSVLCGRLP
jgi:hypothetical protein